MFSCEYCKILKNTYYEGNLDEKPENVVTVIFSILLIHNGTIICSYVFTGITEINYYVFLGLEIKFSEQKYYFLVKNCKTLITEAGQ